MRTPADCETALTLSAAFLVLEDALNAASLEYRCPLNTAYSRTLAGVIRDGLSDLKALASRAAADLAAKESAAEAEREAAEAANEADWERRFPTAANDMAPRDLDRAIRSVPTEIVRRMLARSVDDLQRNEGA